jgi:hypothetical protein
MDKIILEHDTEEIVNLLLSSDLEEAKKKRSVPKSNIVTPLFAALLGWLLGRQYNKSILKQYGYTGIKKSDKWGNIPGTL